LPVSRAEPCGKALLLLTTAAGDEAARVLARTLVEEGLAACVTRHAVKSVYRWKGEVCEDDEVLLVIKTAAGRLPELEAFLESEHPYECPECIALQPARVERAYLDWLLAESAP